MIAVLADDLTGAAEIAGIGWRYGLRSMILRLNQSPVDTDLLVYDTDSRNCSAVEAARRVARTARRLRKLSPDWIYKKVDSVLRGNVLPEITALTQTLGLNRCILVPANPSSRRIIKGGRYFIGGQPLHRTAFALDPTHPRWTANVIDLLGVKQPGAVQLRKPGARTLPAGIVVGDATSRADMKRWAHRVASDTLAAGGGQLFEALLVREGLKPVKASPELPRFRRGSVLYVVGSHSETSRRFVASCRGRHWPVFEMPAGLFHGTRGGELQRRKWASQTGNAFRRHRNIVMTVGETLSSQPGAARRLEQLLAGTARDVLASTSISQVCVEGGATAAALLGALKWTRLAVMHEYDRGVTAVKVEGAMNARVVLKPGSYAWPRRLLE